jgi:hypothetical protein
MKFKRGSHVGMILSFVIFITFIVFLYSVFKPAINTGENKKTILDDVEKQILKNISVNLTTASVQIKDNKNPNDNCVQLQSFLFGISASIDYYYNLKVKDESGNLQTGYQSLYDLAITRSDRTKTFFKVYFSTNFTGIGSLSSSCTTVTSSNFNVGSVSTNNFAFESKINHLASYYTINYDKLKTELRVTPGNEFGFNFTRSDETSINVGVPPRTANVFTDEIPIQYVDSNANIKSGFINIKVW